jgi:hypothetical protein
VAATRSLPSFGFMCFSTRLRSDFLVLVAFPLSLCDSISVTYSSHSSATVAPDRSSWRSKAGSLPLSASNRREELVSRMPTFRRDFANVAEANRHPNDAGSVFCLRCVVRSRPPVTRTGRDRGAHRPQGTDRDNLRRGGEHLGMEPAHPFKATRTRAVPRPPLR